MMKSFLRLFTELSSWKMLSQITGRFAKSKYSKIFIPSFIKAYGIRTEEAEKAVSEYESLNDFFTRRLKQGMRTIDADRSKLVSPVDATIVGIGNVESGQMINVKGQDYTIAELLNHSPRVDHYKNGFYFVLYLSPMDYHRIHCPVNGKIVETEHIAGRVYPVNEFGLSHMRKVLSRNERLVTYLRHTQGEIAVVKVGAMNVSSIQYVDPLPRELASGDELAYFEFGSTVVLLMENDTFTCENDLMARIKVQMGQPLGTLNSKP